MQIEIKTNGGDAVTAYAPTPLSEGEYGLSKREYFAAKALVAFINIQYGSFEVCAQNAVVLADMLIDELNK